MANCGHYKLVFWLVNIGFYAYFLKSFFEAERCEFFACSFVKFALEFHPKNKGKHFRTSILYQPMQS
jgi:hypothetical protein